MTTISRDNAWFDLADTHPAGIPNLPNTINTPAWKLSTFQMDHEWRELAELKLWWRTRPGITPLTSGWPHTMRVLFKELNNRIDEILGELEYRDDCADSKRRLFRHQGRVNGIKMTPTWFPPPRESKISLIDLTRPSKQG